MSKILGLDLGTNSIGWAIVDNEKNCIEAAGSRIIPMDAGRLGDFEKGNSVSFTAERTQYRGARRLRERYLLRRERLLRVLHIMGFLPEHFASQLDRYGKIPTDKEPKIAWHEGKDGKAEFLFKTSFEEMVNEFRNVGILQNIPYDWTIYYLRKKALSKPITREELSWILMQFNQKRGYYQLRGKLDELDTNTNEKKEEREYHELTVIKVDDTGEKDKKGYTWYNITLENGWTYRRPCRIAPDWEGKKRGFIATFKLDKEGKRVDGQPKISSPSEDDWNLRKLRTEDDIQKSGKTIGEYIFNILLNEPNQKIIGETVRTIDRNYYHEELLRILKKQSEFHPELKDRNLYWKCIEELYPSNDAHRNSIAKRDFTYLLVDDILFFQRPLKTKTSLIADCPYEVRNGKPLKCIAKSHPLFQEFRLWQFLSNLHIYQKDNDITSTLLPNNDAYADLYDYLSTQKEVDQASLLRYFKISRKEMPHYRWNYVQDRKYPAGETRTILLGGLRKAGIEDSFLDSEKELHLWHILYSVDDTTQYRKALRTFAQKQGWDDERIEAFAKAFDRLTVYKEKDYGAYSSKAISQLLPLMRRGRYWNVDAINPNTRKRIEHLITGEVDDNLSVTLRERFRHIDSIMQCEGLNTWQACYIVYGRHSEAADAHKWTKPEDIDTYLKTFRHNSLNNPVVEQVVTESLRVVRDIWRQTGHIDEIHIELGRELKKTKAERESMSQAIAEGEATNQRIRLMLAELMNPDFDIENVRPQSPSQQELLKIYEEGVMHSGIEIPEDIIDIQKRFTAAKNQPTHTEIIKYKLWLDQKYISPYTGKAIPLAKLFTPAYQIEHVIPQSRWFDDSMSNKVICEAEVNALKDRQLGHEFIVAHHGEVVPLSLGGTVKILSVEEYENLISRLFENNRVKRKKLMLDDIPDDFNARQLNDSRYISRLMMHLLSNIVRTEDEDGNREDNVTSRNVIPCNGTITDRLKHDWGINDVWNRIILPRFIRLNEITGTTDYTATTAEGHTIPAMPLDLRQGFNKKRIDHRHHAMDAIVIACCTRDHVNILNNEAAKSGTRYDLQNKLRAKSSYLDKQGNKHDVFTDFIKPWPTFTEDVYKTLQSIIVSFKQNLRVINKTTNRYTVIHDGKRVRVKQEKGDSWAIRKPLHKETVFGEVNLQLKKPIAIKKALTDINSIVNRELKEKIKEKKALGYTDKQIIDYLDKNKDIWSEVSDGKVEVYYYTKDTRDRYFATRYKNEITTYLGAASNEVDAKNKIEKITDTGIQKILLHHLVNEGRNPQKAFCPEGVERMNANIISLNDGKNHMPIKKVRVWTKGEKFNLTDKGIKSSKFYNGDDGKNLHYIIYTRSTNDTRNFLVVELQVSVECQKKYGKYWREHLEQFLKEYGDDDKEHKTNLFPLDGKILYILSAGDLVYIPSDIEKDISITDLNPSHIYRIRSFDFDMNKEKGTYNTVFYCIPHTTSKVLPKKVIKRDGTEKAESEFGSVDKTQKDYLNRMIRDNCIPIQVDRLGNITKIG